MQQQQLVFLMLKSSTVKKQKKRTKNKPEKAQTAVIYGSFGASDVQPRTWIYQPLLDPDLLLPTGWGRQRLPRAPPPVARVKQRDLRPPASGGFTPSNRTSAKRSSTFSQRNRKRVFSGNRASVVERERPQRFGENP